MLDDFHLWLIERTPLWVVDALYFGGGTVIVALVTLAMIYLS